MTEVNETQIGGEHYQSMFQHWDLVEMIHLPYLEACATKYILRHRKKNGKQDLEKALHFVQKLLEQAVDYARVPKKFMTNTVTETKFYRLNNVDTNELCLLRILFGNWNIQQLEYCVEILQMMIAEFKEVEVLVKKGGPFESPLRKARLKAEQTLEFNNSGFGEPPEDIE